MSNSISCAVCQKFNKVTSTEDSNVGGKKIVIILYIKYSVMCIHYFYNKKANYCKQAVLEIFC